MTTPTPAPRTRSSQKPILVTTAIVGGIALLGIGVTAAISAFWDRGALESSSATVAVDGVTAVEVDANRGEFVLQFADVAAASLDVEGDDRWTMEREGDELVVKSRNGLFSWGPELCFGICGEHYVTLTLPSALAGVDADLSLGAGSLKAEGEFGDVSLDVGAGAAEVSGEARSVEAEISAGRAEIDLVGVQRAAFEVSAGRGEARLTGAPPQEVAARVSAGSLEIALPDAAYAVSSDVSAGGFDNELRTDPAASNRVTADVSAGSLALRPAR